MEYRKDMDGLRALAVMLVILFHLDIDWVKSGYLITMIIVRDLKNKNFSI